MWGAHAVRCQNLGNLKLPKSRQLVLLWSICIIRNCLNLGTSNRKEVHLNQLYRYVCMNYTQITYHCWEHPGQYDHWSWMLQWFTSYSCGGVCGESGPSIRNRLRREELKLKWSGFSFPSMEKWATTRPPTGGLNPWTPLVEERKLLHT